MTLIREQHGTSMQVVKEGLQAELSRSVYRVPLPTRGALSLERRRRPGVEALRGAVVLIHGFGQNRYTWHTPYLSFANYLAYCGYDVFNLELRGFGRSRRYGSRLPDHPDVHFRVDVPLAVEAVREISGEEKVFLLGHSLGGACSYAATSLITDQIRGLVTFAGLYHVAGLLTSLSRLAFRVAGGGLYGRPIRQDVPVQLIGRTLDRLQLLMNSRAYRSVPLQSWHPTTMDKAVLRFLHREAYERASLGTVFALLYWGRKGHILGRDGHDFLADFERLTIPLFVIAGSRDYLVPARAAKPAFVRSQSPDKKYRCFDPADGGHHWGHVDLILGRDAPACVWPEVIEWLDAH